MRKITILLLSFFIMMNFGCGGGTKKGFLPFLSLDEETDASSKGDTSIESIYVTPALDSIAVETYSKFKATAIYSDGTEEDITNSSTWSSKSTSISTVESDGKAKGIASGNTKIVATKNGMSGSGDLIVTDATLQSIEISAFDPIGTGTSVFYKATGVFSDGSTQDLTDFVEWSSSDESVASINNNDDGTKGKAKGNSVGQTTITASFSGVSGSSTLDVNSKTLVSISIGPDSYIVKDTQKSYTAIGTFSDGSTQDITNDVTWNSSNTGIATIENSVTSKGKATGMSSGDTTISATLFGVTGSAALKVTSASLTSISIGPDVSVAKGSEKQFTAIGTFSDGTTLDITDIVTWTSSVTDIAGISNVTGSEGNAQTLAIGSTEIKAILGGVNGSANLTVTSAALVSISVSPGTDTIIEGSSTQYTATGIYTDDSTQDITNDVTWSSGNDTIATISNISGNNGKATAMKEGSISVTATLDGVSGSANLVVNPLVTLSSISISPSSKSIAKGLTQEYTATAIFSDSTTQDVTASATWKSDSDGNGIDDSSIASISNVNGSNGIATANNQGSTVISATWDGKTGTANLTVTEATLISISITPTNPSVAKGLAKQFVATGTYTDGSTQDITDSVVWKSDSDGNGIDDSSIASISNVSGNNGFATTINQGTTVISASLDGKTASTNLTVTAAELMSLAVTPVNSNVAKGLAKQFTAIATYTDNSTQDVTDASLWSSGTESIATISNASGSQGLATSVDQGTTQISASYGGQAASTNLTVTAASVASIAVTPTNPSVAKGLTKQFTAIATMTDNTTQDVTESATWSSGSESIATISNAGGSRGLADTHSTGTTSISATWNGKTGSTNLEVTAAQLVSITVTPGNQSVSKGLEQQYTATGVYTDGSTQDLTDVVFWESSNNTNAAISNADGSKGLVTTTNVGGTTISATYDSITGSTGLTVTDAALVSIKVTPADQTIAKGNTQEYYAEGTYTDGTRKNITDSVTWKSDSDGDGSDDSLIAGISNDSGTKGLATGTGQGPTIISATLSGVTGGTGLTVTAAALVSIDVTPENQTKETGSTQQYIATGIYTDGTNQTITNSVTWKSDSNGDGVDDSLIAGISNDSGTQGIVTASNPGPTIIIATLNGIFGSTGLTVTAPEGVVDVGEYDVSLPDELTEDTTPTGDYNGMTFDNDNGASGFVSEVPSEPATNCTEFGSLIVGQIGTISGITSSQISNSTVGTSPNCSSIYLLDVTTDTSQKATDLSNTLIQEIGTNIENGSVTNLPVADSGEASSTSFKVIVEATYTNAGTGLVGIGVTTSDDYEANEGILAGFLDGTNVADSGSPRESFVDTFTGEADSKVDFVWVVDNSGSMAEEQGAVTNAATTFFNKLGNKHLDYRIGVLATGVDNGNKSCKNEGTPGYEMRSAGWITSSTPNAQSTFTGTSGVTVGTSGCGIESGIYMAARSIGEGGTATVTPRSGYSWGSDYKLVFIMLSDEADQYKCYSGTFTTKNHSNTTYGPCYDSNNPSFDNSNNVFVNNGYKVYNIIGLNSSGAPGTCTGNGTSAEFENNVWPGYYNIATATGGSSASICSSSFNSIMDSIVTQVAGTTSSYVLSNKAISTTISVKVDGVDISQDSTNGWTYNSSNQTIVFSGTAWPDQGSTIVISYQYYTFGGYAFNRRGSSSLTAYISNLDDKKILIPIVILLFILGTGLYIKHRNGLKKSA